jgi:hypothetical protein
MTEQVNGDHDGGGHGDDQVLKAWKRRKRKKKAQGKGIFDRSFFCFGDQDT